ncbi:MAG TPA: hypothetical protein GXX25_08410 [Desulfotomaculum sp.]|nr:hypothetical protein [Desulfotomaculum sp.]
MKWTKVPPSVDHIFYKAYKKLVDLYFDYNKSNKMFFRTLIVDKHNYDIEHKIFYNGDYEKGFYNLYCQLILNWLLKGNEYHVRLAKRNIKKAFPGDCEELRLLLLKQKLNKKFESRLNKYQYIYGFRPVTPPVKTIEARSANERRLIQLADILTGSVGFYWNKEHIKEGVRPGKISLAQYIASKVGKHNLLFTTNWNDKRFNIFYFDTSKSSYNKNK